MSGAFWNQLLAALRLTRDALLLCLSAFFADLGYQGVAALFPLCIVYWLNEPVYWYGIITGIALGAGSFFAYLGGLAGDRFDEKYVSIAGNAFIPLMTLSGLAHALWLSALLFILGWWARYFRTPAQRALLVHVNPFAISTPLSRHCWRRLCLASRMRGSQKKESEASVTSAQYGRRDDIINHRVQITHKCRRCWRISLTPFCASRGT